MIGVALFSLCESCDTEEGFHWNVVFLHGEDEL